MDKINLADWSKIFGKTSQELVFASDRYTDLRFSFEEPGLASGFMQVTSAPGLRLTEIAAHSGHHFQLVDPENSEAAESVFVLGGDFESKFHNLSAPLKFGRHHHNFQYNQHFGGDHLISPEGFHAFAITYDIAFLKNLLESDINKTMGLLANAMTGRKAYVANTGGMAWNGRVAEVIAGIRNCPFSGLTKYLFLESKMMELFVLQMEQARLALDHKDEAWSAADRERLKAVRNHVESAYLESFSLKDLTYRFGLNEFKLKKGYRELFQTTVFGHVHQLRMQKARNVLESGEMNVSEAAFFVGYNNVSSFCTEFKKRFGISPGLVSRGMEQGK